MLFPWAHCVHKALKNKIQLSPRCCTVWQIIFFILNQSDKNAPADLNQKSTDCILPPQWDAFPKQMHCLLQFGIETHYVTFYWTLQKKTTYHFSSFWSLSEHFFTIRWKKKNRKTLGWYRKKIDSGTSAALCVVSCYATILPSPWLFMHTFQAVVVLSASFE